MTVVLSVIHPHYVCVNLERNLPVKPQREWVHMDKLEPEKLEWMRDLPAPRRKRTKQVFKSDTLFSLIFLS